MGSYEVSSMKERMAILVESERTIGRYAKKSYGTQNYLFPGPNRRAQSSAFCGGSLWEADVAD